jgi:pimeloyl-ACP methyl ester carboxylesterase
MERWHQFWLERDPAVKRHVVLYAHGGMVSEKNGLEGAQRDLNWWLNNRVYPIYFAWQTGPAETLLNQLTEMAKNKLPFGGLGFDLVEQFDRWVEKFTRSTLRWMWEEMKENARAASDPIKNLAQVQWPPPSLAEQQDMANLPGASLTVTRLAKYVKQHGPSKVKIHLVGHSAGSIFHAALLQRLAEAKLKVESMALLSPAIRMDEFRRDILPNLGRGKTVARFAVFNLSDKQELDDALPPGSGGLKVYHKSLLYLVSRGLEPKPGSSIFEVPLLGMQRFFDQPLDGRAEQTVQAAITGLKGDTIVSPSADPADSRSEAATHVDFDDDSPTLTSVLMRILGVKELKEEYNYRPNAPLADADHVPSLDRASVPSPVPEAAAPFTPAAEVEPPGEAQLVETAQPQTEQPTPPPQPAEIVAEVAVAPRSGSSVVDVLQADGWEIEEATPTLAAPEKPKKEAKKPKRKKKAAEH